MIYFVQSTTTRHIKIGFSDEPKHRLSGLQVGNSRRLRLLATCEGGREQEKELHRAFEKSKLKGEWFLPTADILLHTETYSTPFYIVPEKNALKKKRIEQYLTLEIVGNRLGMTKQSAADAESRFLEGTITINALKKYAEAINYDVDIKFTRKK